MNTPCFDIYGAIKIHSLTFPGNRSNLQKVASSDIQTNKGTLDEVFGYWRKLMTRGFDIPSQTIHNSWR